MRQFFTQHGIHGLPDDRFFKDRRDGGFCPFPHGGHARGLRQENMPEAVFVLLRCVQGVKAIRAGEKQGGGLDLQCGHDLEEQCCTMIQAIVKPGVRVGEAETGVFKTDDAKIFGQAGEEATVVFYDIRAIGHVDEDGSAAPAVEDPDAAMIRIQEKVAVCEIFGFRFPVKEVVYKVAFQNDGLKILSNLLQVVFREVQLLCQFMQACRISGITSG